MKWPFSKKTQPQPQQADDKPKCKRPKLNGRSATKEYPFFELVTPSVDGVAMDAKFESRYGLGVNEGVPAGVGQWYARQSFIGAVQAAWIARHWLIDKAVIMPSRDALRQGWELTSENPDVIDTYLKADKKLKINSVLHKFVSSSRRTGGAVAVLLTCPAGEIESEYYQNPLNEEAITEYHGIAIVDATNATAILSSDDVSNPASLDYMCPSFYQIGNRRYHKSHCVTLTPFPVSDILKPSYGYFGQSLPERIYSRVYAAERTADEAPNLAMTKRLRLLGVDLESVISGGDGDSEALSILNDNIHRLQEIASNEGVFVYDTANGGGMSQLDTSLADFDALVMTQYQLVASIAGVPSTKLLGTTPKGFNATGEYESEDYRQSLESIQTHDLQPLLERHYRIISIIKNIETCKVVWMPLDSPTAKEFAEIDQIFGNTVSGMVAQGVLNQEQALTILSKLKDSIFADMDTEYADTVNGEADGLLDQVMSEIEEDESN